jgi:predicted AAA+ superfamily ATPase
VAIIKSALLTHNQHWQKKYSKLQDRQLLKTLIKRLSLKQVQVLQGIRRSGKSSLFKLLINHLCQSVDSKSILYINLDDPYFSELYSDSKNMYKLLELSQSITNIKVEYLFLDEVQNVTGWEKFVKAIYDNELVKKIFITGSNASLLEGEFATLLSGRYVSDTLYPPSFSELVAAMGISDTLSMLQNKPKLLATVESMMEYGSFWEVIKEDNQKRELILSYYDTIVYKDCIANNKIREAKTFKEVLHYLVSNATNTYSYNSLAKALGLNDNTVKEYIRVMESSYFMYELKSYSYSLKEQIKGKKKSYFIDNGFVAQTAFRFSENRGKLFENLVFSELIKKGYELFFINEEGECDFIAKSSNGLIAVQVCYELTPQNIEREKVGLQKLKFNATKKIIITFNQSMQENDLEIVSFIDYFGFCS